jgi:hypothetical protein
MSESNVPSPEINKERDIANSIKELHSDFLARVPNYERKRWDPRYALRNGTGSCMAELLYVAGGLLAQGRVNEEDITVGFSKTHGEEEPIGFVGKAGRKYAHTFVLITLGTGVTLEADFRANRADEEPRIQRLQAEELDEDDVYLGSLTDAIATYAQVEGAVGPTVSELIALHYEDLKPNAAVETSQSPEDEVRFDQDF